jgi:sporulation protein YlmC with PRC-barrel domain
MNSNSLPPNIIAPPPSRTRLWLAVSIALTLFAASAQDVSTPPGQKGETNAVDGRALEKDQPRDAAGSHPRLAPEGRFAEMQRCSQLIGLSVRDPDTHRLGKIRDLLVDLHSGQLICALVESRSVKDDLVPVPAEAFTGADRDRAVLKGTKKNFNDAPRFSGEIPDPSVLLQAINDSYDYFNEKPRQTLSPGPHHFSKFSTLTGRPITNPSGEDLGKVADLMIDLPAGRIVFAVVSLDEKGHNLYAVPPSALQTKPDGPELMLDLDWTSVSHLAPYNDFFWANLADPVRAARIYATFGQNLDSGAAPSNPDSTRENVRARVEPALAVEKGPDRRPDASDSEITQGILTAIVRDQVNHFPVRAIRVVTVNGHVTLSGRVENEGQKRKLDSFAAKLVGRENVDDQLQTGR